MEGDETSEESVNDEEDEEDEENARAAGAGVRLLTPAVGSISNHHHHHHGHLNNHHHSHSSSFSQQQHNSNSTSNMISSNHHLQHRKSFPPISSSAAAKVFRAPPVWKSGDEMISVSVPRKARSASTKRSHDWISSSSNNNSGGVSGGEQILRQESSSPARQGLVSTSSPSPAAPMSPSSSNVSMRKKLKPNVNSSGPKLKPPKVSSKPSSSNNEELEIEIAEVLYGLKTQSQGPSSKKEDSREVNRSSSDAKSRNSSPISNSTATNNPILGPNSSPLSAVAPKRKRPRQVPENSGHGGRSASISTKPDADQTPKSEISSPNLEKISGSATENSVNSGGQPPEPALPEPNKLDSDLKPVADELMETRDLVAKEELTSPKERESPAPRAEDSNKKDSPSTATASSASTMIKANSMVSEVETQKEEKFEIDLMAPPPQVRSPRERDTKPDADDQKPVVSLVDADLKLAVEKDKEDEKSKSGKDHSANVASEEKKGGEEVESNKKVENKGRNIDLQLDLERPERDCSPAVNASGNKLQLQTQKQKPQQQQMPTTEKSGHSTSSVPLPMSMANWAGGLPPMGYMAPLQGVVSMDGSSVTPAHIQPLFSQPRPKRCATHCHIARNIHCLQQLMNMNPFWPAPAGSASLFGSKPCNLNVLPAADPHGNLSVKGVSNAPDKGQGVPGLPNHTGKEKGSQPASTSDPAQRKQQQILIQQSLPQVAPSNLLGHAFIFPLNQQQAAVAARPGTGKTSTAGGSSNPSSSAAASAASAATAMSFNYPNMAANEAQYLAILQNNAYPFPIPAAAGAPPNYRGAPAQAMPMFNGSFFSSPMIHPSQLQPPSTQSQQLLQAHQSASASSGSSASQKHLQSQQQRPQSSGSGSASLQNFSSQKTQPAQQSHNQYVHPSRPRHLEGEPAGEDSPSTTDSRGSRHLMNIYGQNFAMPIHPHNFALMTPPAGLAAAASGGGGSDQVEKKGHQPHQQGLKNGVDSLPPHSFAMSFGPANGTTGQGIDITSMAQNHSMFQSSSEAARQSIQMMAAAAAAAAQVAQKKNVRISEDNKSGGADSSATDDERKILAGKALGGVGQSIAFTRSDLTDAPVTSIQDNNVIESSARSSGPARSSRPMTTNAGAAMNVANAHIQAQLHQQQQMLKHQQQQQMLKHQQQQQQQMTSRSKVPVTSNGNIYSEHLNSSSSMAAKFPNPLSGLPQNLVQTNSSSPVQSPQWKGSTRTPTSQVPSSLALNATTLKNLPQQHSRPQTQMHAQISFGGSQKPSASSQGQAPPSSNQAPSSPMMVGSPTTSSISKGASGSPRTTASSSGNNKMGQASSLSQQPPKTSQSIPSQKSPSILGNPHIASSGSSSGAKTQMQQQLPKGMQQAQLFFSNPYSQSQSPHSTSSSSATSGPSGYYMQRRRPDQHQQTAGAPVTSSTGMLSLCPSVTLASTSTNDPAKAIAAATCNVKGGGLSSQGMIHASQFASQSTGTLLPAGFSYVHPVPTAVQVKPAEQKQPAGNDNLHPWQPEKK